MSQISSRREAGFTLIETMAAITIFTIMTLGITPLLASSIKGASVSRSYTAGKNVAVEAMERARGLPFFVDYPTQKSYSGTGTPRKVDLLDLYYPVSSGSGTYTTVCTSSTTDPACPASLPADYTLEFQAQFVTPQAGGTGEQYVTVVPPSSYQWDPEPYAGQDQPPSQMLQVTVAAIWTYGGEQKTVDLTGIIGDRDFGEISVTGNAKVDYAVQVTTTRTNESTGEKTTVTGTAGMAQSEIETKTQSTANQNVTAATIQVSDLPLDPSGEVVELPPVEGAITGIHSPPDSTPSGASVGVQSALHDDFGVVGGMDGTTTSGLKVSVSQELPTATGAFGFSAPTGSERLFYIDSQLGPDNASTLRLDDAEGLLKFTKRGSGTISGSTSADTTAVNSSGRHVQTAAAAAFQRLRFLSTSFIQSVITDVNGDAVHRSVLVVNNFQSSVSCKATASSSTATAAKSWSATMYFWRDNDPSDHSVNGSYQSIPLSSSLSSDPLAPYGPNAQNPVVYDAPLGEEDIYLFQAPGKKGYLQSWSSAVGETAEVSADGRITNADLSDAIRLVSAPTHSSHGDSAFLVKIGKLGCEAQDQR